jgi:hypothetical protein
MQDGEVIGFAECVVGELPIHLHRHRTCVKSELPAEVPAGEFGAESGKITVDLECRTRLRLEPDDSVFFRDRQRYQAVTFAIELAETLLLWKADQLPFQIVSPGVKRTGETQSAAALLIDETGAAVPTGVQKRSYLAVVASREHERCARRILCDE